MLGCLRRWNGSSNEDSGEARVLGEVGLVEAMRIVVKERIVAKVRWLEALGLMKTLECSRR